MPKPKTEFIRTAHLLADAARPLAREAWFAQGETRYKQDASAVTDADLRIETRLREIVSERHPDHGLLGEEFGATAADREFTWVIDPIDGTRHFGARLLNFGVLIGLCQGVEPILGIVDQPLANARFFAASGGGATLNGARIGSSGTDTLNEAKIALANPNSFTPPYDAAFRKLSGAGRMTVFDGGCLAYSALARGMVDICLNGPDLDPFDICPLVPIVREAGGVITSWTGEALSLDYAGPIVASATPDLHQEVLALTRGCLA